MSLRFPSTGLIAAATLLAASGWVHAQSTTAWHAPLLPAGSSHPASANRPYWVDETLEPSGTARISRMIEGKADVVVLDGGLYQGFRTGVFCLVERAGQPVAQLIVVACEQDRAAALITNQPNTVILVPGDVVRLEAKSIQ